MELDFLKRQERKIGRVVTPSSSLATSFAANYSWQRNIVQEENSDTLVHLNCPNLLLSRVQQETKRKTLLDMCQSRLQKQLKESLKLTDNFP